MIDRIRRSWLLTCEAWNVLRQDRILVLFPILSGIAVLFVLASFALPVALLFPWSQFLQETEAGRRAAHFDVGALHYVGVFLCYLLTYFVGIFFNVGLVACVRKRLAGETPTVGDGLNFALANVGRIFQWSLLNATVGTILKMISERAGWIADLVANLVGFVWSLATFFVVPVLVYEQVNPLEALKRSAAVFRKTWGESVSMNLGMGIAFGLLATGGTLLMILGLILGFSVIGNSLALGAGIVVVTLIAFVAYLTALGVLQSTLQGIFLTACYQYATTGVAPSHFTHDYVVAAWSPKSRGGSETK